MSVPRAKASEARRAPRAVALLLPLLLAACASAKSEGPSAPREKPAIRGGASIDPKALMGESPAEVRRLLGEPSLLRKERDVEVWQYAGASCVLLVYLYADNKGAPAVTYLDARAAKSGAMPVPECLAALQRG